MPQNDDKKIQYGSQSRLMSKCPRCGESVDKHKLAPIKPSEAVTKMAQNLQAQLSQMEAEAIRKGYEIPREELMVGAAIATIGSERREYLAVSGYCGLLLACLDRGKIGKNVVVVNMNGVPGFIDPLERSFTPSPAPGQQFHMGNYKGCAAQKLLFQIFTDAKARKQKVTNLEMCEIFWKVTGEKSNWSSGQVVPSCDNCKQILPQMLCDIES